ncbi:hypothetical protein AD945_10050 [Gluconobacter albidus]|uniref:HTH cro/C1-type domain-containing protein n=1 Tax=Gluconobacter albidus TaxID=318683 RepID=A0A149THN1_9PROT|nr:helix-turn-helix transcriptional regulator [Gluconobacter albidus]KXV47386.1 hypothetical protein AD945_10050 [Gluconobacter albidus]
MKNDENLGARLRKLRKERKLAQADVAAAVNISRSHLAEIEAGKNPGFVTFIELADYFSVSLDYLYSGSGVGADNQRNSAVEGQERVLLEFWRNLEPTQRMLLFDLLIGKNITPNVA